jgi:hypothetical protein
MAIEQNDDKVEWDKIIVKRNRTAIRQNETIIERNNNECRIE